MVTQGSKEVVTKAVENLDQVSGQGLQGSYDEV